MSESKRESKIESKREQERARERERECESERERERTKCAVDKLCTRVRGGSVYLSLPSDGECEHENLGELS